LYHFPQTTRLVSLFLVLQKPRSVLAPIPDELASLNHQEKEVFRRYLLLHLLCGALKKVIFIRQGLWYNSAGVSKRR
jgi:hypothetical protein